MKKITLYIAAIAFLFIACEQKVDYVNPIWAQVISPSEGAAVKIDFFKPNDTVVFKWKKRKDATYKIYFDIDMHFQNPYIFDMGTKDSLDILNADLLKALRTICPDFTSIKRFFWKLEQNLDGNFSTVWRYFDAVLVVERFVDERDNEKYEASQFITKDGSLITIMAENLRAKVNPDGSELLLPYKEANTEDPTFRQKAGGYYTWATAMNGVTWEEAKIATQKNKPVQGICPDGWHLPSYLEINKLIECWGVEDGGNTVKDPSYWRTTGNITNSNKMNIIASGYYWHEGVTALTGSFEGNAVPVARIWSASPCLKGMDFAWGQKATEDDPGRAVLMSLSDDVEGVYMQAFGIRPLIENSNSPVRCIMDEIK